jgi:hypothetical protein
LSDDQEYPEEMSYVARQILSQARIEWLRLSYVLSYNTRCAAQIDAGEDLPPTEGRSVPRQLPEKFSRSNFGRMPGPISLPVRAKFVLHFSLKEVTACM